MENLGLLIYFIVMMACIMIGFNSAEHGGDNSVFKFGMGMLIVAILFAIVRGCAG